MPAVVKEIGFYNDPAAIGYAGWIKTKIGTYFIDNDGKISMPKGMKPEKPVPVLKPVAAKSPAKVQAKKPETTKKAPVMKAAKAKK